MIKVMRTSKYLEMGVFVGIDPNSDGLARAQRLGVATTHEGIEGLLKHPLWPEIGYVFDATSAKAHVYNYNQIKSFEGKRVDRKSTRLNSSHIPLSRMPSSA